MRTLWAQENLHAWTVAPFDAVDRSPHERVAMLARLGFKNYAYSWRHKHVPTFDAELEALERHRIKLLAWNFLALEPDDPLTSSTLDLFKRHHVTPQLWVMQSHRDSTIDPKQWRHRFPRGPALPQTHEEYLLLSDADKVRLSKALAQTQAAEMPPTPAQQDQRVHREAERIRAFAELAAPYGCRVALYNHNDWFGMIDNQLAILERLHQLGVDRVGIVYNFSHCRDELHDDTTDFQALWKKIQPYVLAVNVSGVAFEGLVIYPSQGDAELEMMRTIQDSGWQGAVGLIAEKGGDAEITLRNCLTGLHWLAAELQQPGSGGERPFPTVERDALS